MKFVVILLGLCCFHQVSGVTHTLQYFYTATSGIPNFPEFISLGVLDGQQLDYYDSITKKVEPRAKWMTAAVDSDYWSTETQKSAGSEQSFKVSINVVKSRFNQSEGIHTFQYMYGCEWNDETKQKNGFRQLGFDGEDFMVYDMETFRWIAPVQQAEISQRKWNSNQAGLEYLKNYITDHCIEWLQKYVKYGETTWKQASPEVSLLKKDHSSEVACHATGFYPEGVMITWKKDDIEIHENVYVGNTLPNEDGTFQKRAVLTVSSEERKNSQYTCEVVHTSGKPIVKVWTESNGSFLGIIIGCVVVALVAIGAVVGFVMMRRKGESKVGKNYTKAEQADTDSENSNPMARKGAECDEC